MSTAPYLTAQVLEDADGDGGAEDVNLDRHGDEARICLDEPTQQLVERRTGHCSPQLQ